MTATECEPVAPEATCGDAGGRRADGEPCRSTLGLGTTGLCLQHDPERANEAHLLRSTGGLAARDAKIKAKAALPDGVPKAPKTLEDAVQWSSWAMYAVATGEIDARTGHEVGYLVNAFKAAVEKRDLLQEIEKLRAELAAARKRPPA